MNAWAFSFRWLRGVAVTRRWPSFLWSEIYRGVEIGRLWIGWTAADFERRGW